MPKDEFYNSGSWKDLCDWKTELKPHYEIAKKMLGSALNPKLGQGDLVMKDIAKKRGIENHFAPTEVAIFFGESDKEVDDPYFGGKGPRRSACTFCGGCMTGCRFNAKNTLDKNYLYLAQKLGVEVIAEQEVYDVHPINNANGQDGYFVISKKSTSLLKSKSTFSTKNVIFSGGVLGTMNLLLKLKKKKLPNLSNRLGMDIRTNNEALIFNITADNSYNLSEGIAIGSILDVDKSTHLEVVRYNKSSGFWRIGMLPNVEGGNLFHRIAQLISKYLTNPLAYLKITTVNNFGNKSAVLLFMQHIDTKLSFSKGLFRLKTSLTEGKKPVSQIPLAYDLAEEYSKKIGGKPMVFLSETLFNIPSTAHILGGAVMGDNIKNGVIDKYNKVFGYKNLMICDGSTVSANPGVNPSLTISAITEHAMNNIPYKRDI